MNEQDISIDFSEVFQIIKKRKKIIIWLTLLPTILAAAITIFFIKPTYQSSESVIVSKQETGASSASYNYNDVLMYQNLLKTYAAIAQNKEVAQQTVDDLNLKLKADALLKEVKITPRQSTQIIDITVQSKNPQEAYNIAVNFTDNFIKKANVLLPTGSITVLQKAEFPINPVKPNLKLNTAIAFVLGLMLSFGVVFLIEYNDNTIKTEKDIEKILDIPVIGIIPLETGR